MTQNDSELLQRYVADRSEGAFAELVGRHIDLIYSAALRQTNGDAHAAEDITQGVFESLAAKAGRLAGHASLAGWLHTTTRYVASNLRRSERRRLIREQEAHAMNQLLQPAGPAPDWATLQPVIDDTLGELDAEDREAVLLKFFQGCQLAEIGARLGIKENTARMRIERALEKLRIALAKRGITSTASILAVSLAANAVAAAPAGLAFKVCRTAVTGAGAAGGLTALLGGAAAKFALAVLVLAVVAVSILRHSSAAHRAALTTAGLAATTATNAGPEANPGSAVSAEPSHQSPTAVAAAGPKIVLYLDDPKTHQPVPGVQVSKDGFRGRIFQTGKDGDCEIDYPSNTTELELTTRLDGYADTRLDWHPDRGDKIPEFYAVHLAASALIGGRVVDEQGSPVAGAKVGWNHEEAPATAASPESHEFGWIEVATDADGRWQINRIAPEMVRRLYGSVRHPDYVDTPLIFVAREPEMEKALRDGTCVFRLGAGMAIRGVVKDPDGQPVAGAQVFVGYVRSKNRRESVTASDGTFVIPGCKAGDDLLTAAAPGFATATREINITTNPEPFQITLLPGRLLRLLVQNPAGEPIPQAAVSIDTINRGTIDSRRYDAKRVQVDFDRRTGPDGRLDWTNAPEGDLNFHFSASGYMSRGDIYLTADGEDHVITLNPALIVNGLVRDADTGEPIEHFHIGIGWPRWDPVNNRTNAEWNSSSRLWPEFSGGQYQQTLEEAALGGYSYPRYVLKFEADGYSSFVSRPIAADEGRVRLDVALRRANALMVTVLDPDGRRAAGAEVGLVSPDAQLQFSPGGFFENGFRSPHVVMTDPSGVFKFVPDETVTRMMIMDSSGYAETTPAALKKSPTVALQSWGRIEGACLSCGRPVAGREYLFELAGSGELGGSNTDSIDSDFMACKVESDTNGIFTFPKAPPGKHYLVRLIRQSSGFGDGTARMHGMQTEVVIQPGETTPVIFDDKGYTVTANIQWPGGLRPTNAQIHAFLHTPLPAIPPEWKKDLDLRRKFYRSPEFQAALKTSRQYPMTTNPDGKLLVEDIPPGDYTVSVTLIFLGPDDNPDHGMSGREIAVTVPADPPTGKLEVGMIELDEMPIARTVKQ